VTWIETSLDETTAAVVPLLQSHAAIILPSHPVNARPPALELTRRFTRYTVATDNHYYVELNGSSFEDYLHRLPRQHRHEIQRKLRRYLRPAATRSSSATTRRRKMRGHSLLWLGPCRRRPIRTGCSGLGCRIRTPSAPSSTSMPRAARCGAICCFIAGSRPLSAIARERATACALSLPGDDPAFAAWSPGIVLVHEMLRSIAGEGHFSVLDFGSGEAQYKRLFATASRLCATVFFFRPSPRHLIKVLAHRGCIAVSDGCTAAAERLGIKSRLKRLLRARAAGRAL
jgi:hypothetical protein